MWAVRAGFQLRMCLGCDEPRMRRDLDHLNDTSVWGNSGEHHAILLKNGAVIVVDLIAMTMTLMNRLLTVELVCLLLLIQNTRIGAET